jgi:glycolate oxidase
MLAIFDDLSDACQTVANVFQAGVVPTTLELLDNIFINCVEDYAHVGLPKDAQAVLLIEVDGDKEVLDKQIAQISHICRLRNARSIVVAKDEEEAERLWVARRASFASVSAIAPTIVGEDATVPRDKIPQAVADIRKIAEKYKLKIAVVGHAGDGNLHATILCDERDAALMERVEKAAEEIFKSSLALGGTLSGEHGIGRAKAKYLVWETGTEALALMRSIKKTFDPNNILNPGQFLGKY